MFQVSVNSIQNIWVIVRKQNFYQSFNLIVDATRHNDHRQSIGRNFSLKNLANKIREIWACILEALMKNLHLFITQFFGFDETFNNDESLGLTWTDVFYAVSTIFHPCNGSDY